MSEPVAQEDFKKVIDVKGIGKEFNGVWVLKDIDFDLREGEIHSLVGENGAGKSTFIKILSGVHKLSKGKIFIDGEQVIFESVKDSEDKGIRTVHQEINLVPYFNAYENIYIGSEIRKNIGHIPVLDDKAMKIDVKKVVNSLGLDFDLDTSVQLLSTTCQKVIEISKVLVQEPKVIIFDEPTTALGEDERERLLNIIKDLKKKGYSIIFISHNLGEIMDISDRITVFRDGNKIDTVENENIEMSDIITMMLGHESYDEYNKNSKCQYDENILEVKNLSTKKLKGINFEVKKGEILGIAGIVGAGKTEVAKALFGLDKILEGEIKLKDKNYIPSPKNAIKNGIALIPEERKSEGLISNYSITQNTTITYLDKWCNFGVINNKDERKTTLEYIKRLNTKTTGPEQKIKYLSGGNQQKVILSRWLTGNFDLGIFDEPTKGIDIKAKDDIYTLLDELAEDGKSIIFLSSYLPELLSVCHRILVINNGEIVKEFNPRQPNAKEMIMTTMMGGKN